MDYSEFSKQIKQDKIGGAYLLHGEEEYIKDRAVNTIVDKYVAQGLFDLNYDKLDGTECSVSDIKNAMGQLPMMSPKRVVVVASFALFGMTAAQLKQTGNAAALEEIEQIVVKCPNETLLLFLTRGQASTTASKVFSKKGRDVSFKSPDNTKKIQYAARMAKDIGLVISNSTINFLINYTGAELLEISFEMQKLKAYSGMREAMREDVEQVCTAAAEYDVFKMLKQIAAKDSAGAIAQYRKLVEAGQQPHAVLSMIERQYRALFYKEELVAMGIGGYKDAAKKLGTKDFVIKNMMRQSAGLSDKKIKKIALWCADADYHIKRGKLTPDTSAEMLIAKLVNI